MFRWRGENRHQGQSPCTVPKCFIPPIDKPGRMSAETKFVVKVYPSPKPKKVPKVVSTELKGVASGKQILEDEEGERGLPRCQGGGFVRSVLRLPIFHQEGQGRGRLRGWERALLRSGCCNASNSLNQSKLYL